MKIQVVCPQCTKEILFDEVTETEVYEVTCQHCKYSFIVRPSDIEAQQEQECDWEENGEQRKTLLCAMKKISNKPNIAAILLCIMGGLGLFTASILDSELGAMLPGINNILSFLSNNNTDGIVLFFILIVFSFISIIGAITAFTRRFFIFTLVCTIIGMFSIGLYIGFILAIIVLWLLLTSRDEFKDESKGKTF